MKTVPMLPGEEALCAWIQSVLDAAYVDPQVKQWLKEIANESEKDLITPLKQWQHIGRTAGNGWNSPVNNAEWARTT